MGKLPIFVSPFQTKPMITVFRNVVRNSFVQTTIAKNTEGTNAIFFYVRHTSKDQISEDNRSELTPKDQLQNKL